MKVPPPSKTQRKREMTALQRLGEGLLDLNREQRARIELPDALRDALDAAAGIASHEARRRQLQYIGKLMRTVDPEPIRRALDNSRGPSRTEIALLHRCEALRDRLLDDDGALDQFIASLPNNDAQRLRATVRAARRERAGNAPPRHARMLYQWLHAHSAGDEASQ